MPVQQSRVVGNVPPFATNLPDSAYKSRQPITGRAPVQREARPTSAYDHYDGVFDNNDAAAGIGAGFMNADDSDDSSDDEAAVQSTNKHSALAAATRPEAHRVSSDLPLAAPRPGYASRPPVLDPKKSPSPPSPNPGAAEAQQERPPVSRQNSQPTSHRQAISPQNPALRNGAPASGRRPNPPGLQIPPAARTPVSSRSSPYFDEKMDPNALLTPTFDPRQPNTVSIAPSVSNSGSNNSTFAPAFVNIRNSVLFNEEALSIMRGRADGMVIPRRGARGDHFWRRFSTIAKEEKNGKGRSSWLTRNQSGKRTLSRVVWVITIILVVCIAGGVGAGWYFGHNTPPSKPKALGGSADINSLNVTTPSSTVKKASSTVLHVSPTNTVAKREASPLAIPAGHAQRRRTTQF